MTPTVPKERPQRIQLSRKRGWKKPDNTIVVARPGKWGNPFKVGGWFAFGFSGMTWCQAANAEIAAQTPGRFTLIATRAQAVEWFRNYRKKYPLTEKQIGELRGKNLACWCPLPKPGEPDICHASVLLEIANT